MIIKPKKKFWLSGIAPYYAGGGAVWTPASGTAFWYKSDTGVFSDAGVTPATAGGTVLQWNDQSGNARHLTATLSGNHPTLTSAVLNGLPGLLWTNNNSTTLNSEMATTTSFTLAQPFTTVIVFKNGAGGPNNNIGGMSAFGILIDGDAAQAAVTRMIMFAGRNDATTPNDATYFGGIGAGKDAGVTFAANTAYHYAAVFDDTNGSHADINGTTTSAAAGTIGSGGIVNGISVGSSGTATGIGCYICEMFCIPDASHLAAALAYVNARYGV